MQDRESCCVCINMLNSEKLILLFYKFLVVYEKQLKDETKDGFLKSNFPDSYSLLKSMFANVTERSAKQINKVNVADIVCGKGHYSIRSMTPLDNKKNKRKNVKVNKLLSICFHIRNSYAHALAEETGDIITIEDRNLYGKKSACFKMKKSDLENAFNTIIQESKLF